MGAIFAIVFFLILLFIGFILVIGGIIGCVVFKKISNRILTIISSVVMVVGIVIVLIPILFFGFIFMINVLPPDDYVETDIVIEEDGYQDEMFTADGIKYINTGLEAYDVYDIMTPVFSYKTSGLLNGSQCGNYYLIENDMFYLITDGMGNIFCKEEDFLEIVKYYDSISNGCWYIEDEELIGLTDAATLIMVKLYSSTHNVILEPVSYVNGIEYDVVGLSNDNIVLLEYFWFVYDGEFIYYCYEYHSDTDLYSGYKFNSSENEVLKEAFGLK